MFESVLFSAHLLVDLPAVKNTLHACIHIDGNHELLCKDLRCLRENNLLSRPIQRASFAEDGHRKVKRSLMPCLGILLAGTTRFAAARPDRLSVSLTRPPPGHRARGVVAEELRGVLEPAAMLSCSCRLSESLTARRLVRSQMSVTACTMGSNCHWVRSDAGVLPSLFS